MLFAQANEKLLKEMDKNDNKAIDSIHVWLNQNMTEEIATGVLKEDRTIQAAYKYVCDQAWKDKLEMVEDEVVFGWVRDFYTLDDIKPQKVSKPKVEPKVVIPSKPSKKKVKKKENSLYEQLELF